MAQRLPRKLWAVGLALAHIGFAAPVALATDFYDGKQIRLAVGSDAGGGYDTYARLIARHWPSFIPGTPAMVVQNMPGASSLKAMNFVASTAPKDGTVIGAVQNQIAYEPLLGLSGGSMENLQFDPLAVNWLGSMAKEVAIVFVWHSSPVMTFEDAMKQEIVMASAGVTTASSINARLMNAMVGTKFKMIYGYKGNAEIALAIERGEVVGSTGWYYSSLTSSRGQWLPEGKVRIIVQLALEKHPEMPDVPLITDYVKSADDRQQIALALGSGLMGRPYVAPADVPGDRVKILRDSFMTVLASPALQDEARKMRVEINPMSGEAIQKLLAEQYRTPKPLVAKVRALLTAEK